MPPVSGIGSSGIVPAQPAPPDGIPAGGLLPVGFIQSPGASAGDGSADGTAVVFALQSLEESVFASGNLAFAAILSALASQIGGIVNTQTNLRNEVKHLNDQETGQQGTLKTQQDKLAQDQQALDNATDPKDIKALTQQVQADKDAIAKTQAAIATTQGNIDNDTNELNVLQSLLGEVMNVVSALSDQLVQNNQKQANEGQTNTIFTHDIDQIPQHSAESLRDLNAGQRHDQRIGFDDYLSANQIQNLIDRATALNQNLNSPSTLPPSDPSRVRISL